MKYPSNLQRLFESKADELIRTVVSKSGRSESEWPASAWKDFVRELAIDFFAQTHKLAGFVKVGNAYLENARKKWVQDHKRIANRKDQIDKRAFQKAITDNIAEYKNKADAIRDLRANKRFEDYPDTTLRNWLKDVWDRPTKRGRPKKDRK